MSVFERACLIIYRVAEKGLEIFLVQDENEENPVWSIPKSEIIKLNPDLAEKEMIELDPVDSSEGKCQAIAVEGDWHDIPSLREYIEQDVKFVKKSIQSVLPDSEKGIFLGIKEAIKKVLPHEYAFLKELKEILSAKNQVENL